MLRILRKATSSSSSSNTPRSIPVEDLSVWEFVDPSLSDDDLLSYSSCDDQSESEDEHETDDHEEELEEEDTPRDAPDDVMSLQSLSVSPPVAFPLEVVTRHLVPYEEGSHRYDDEDDDAREEEEEEEEEDVYEDDVDDELVPWKVKGKFGKQRIRKMGKRGGPKPTKSKRLPHFHNRPGCVYGKHGLGVQHSYI